MPIPEGDSNVGDSDDEGAAPAPPGTGPTPPDAGPTPHTSPGQRLSSALKDARLQAGIGIVGAIAAVLALAPVVQPAFQDDLKLQVVESSIGQLGAPSFVIPLPLEDLGRPPSTLDDADTIEDWRRANGGVLAGTMTVSFVARSDIAAPSIITAVRVEVVSRRPPLTGTLIMPSGSGDLLIREVHANLDPDPPTATIGRGWNFPLQVSEEDVELFSITATTTTCYCTWRVHLDVVGADGKSRTEVVDDDGRPFALTAAIPSNDTTFLPEDETSEWPR